MSKLLSYFSLSLFFLFHLACFEPSEGCLDVDATNYMVDADDACADCCIFPSLKVDVEHRVDFTGPDTSFIFRYEEFYPNSLSPGDSFVIDRARFYISDIKLIRETGEEVGVLDTLQLEILSGNPVTIEDNFVKVDRDIFAARTVGTILTTGTFTGVKFTLGLEEFLLETDPVSVPIGHPLSTSDDVLNYDTLTGTYIPHMVIFRRDTAAVADSLFLTILEPQSLNLDFDAPFELSRGFDVNLTLRIDYMKWFENVDMNTADLAAIETAIRQNLPNSISVAGISQ